MEPDLKRLGIFKELSYTTIDDPYVTSRSLELRSRTNPRGIPPLYMAGGYSKKKAAHQDGYFGPFASASIGDGAMTYADIQRQARREAKSKRIGRGEWIPSGNTKKRSGTGSSYGNFQEIHEALDPAVTNSPKLPQMKNFYTNPGKKGTGSGYVDICLNPFPAWQPGDSTVATSQAMREIEQKELAAGIKGRLPFISMSCGLDAFDKNPWAAGDPLAPGGPVTVQYGIAAFPKSMQIGPAFKPSHPAKKDGGMKDGTINRFPEYSSEPYQPFGRVYKVDKSKYVASEWIPNPETAITIPQPSIVDKNMKLHHNSKTYKYKEKVWDMC